MLGVDGHLPQADQAHENPDPRMTFDQIKFDLRWLSEPAFNEQRRHLPRVVPNSPVCLAELLECPVGMLRNGADTVAEVLVRSAQNEFASPDRTKLPTEPQQVEMTVLFEELVLVAVLEEQLVNN
jgi:hypothetical protein